MRGAESGPTAHELAKHAHYPTRNADGSRVVGHTLLPVVISTLGGFGAEGVAGLQRIFRLAPSQRAAPFTRLALAVQHGVARQLRAALIEGRPVRAGRAYPGWGTA